MTRKMPKVTELVLQGLTNAYVRMEADDLTDLSDEEDKAMRAANEWIKKAWQVLSERKNIKEGENL